MPIVQGYICFYVRVFPFPSPAVGFCQCWWASLGSWLGCKAAFATIWMVHGGVFWGRGCWELAVFGLGRILFYRSWNQNLPVVSFRIHLTKPKWTGSGVSWCSWTHGAPRSCWKCVGGGGSMLCSLLCLLLCFFLVHREQIEHTEQAENKSNLSPCLHTLQKNVYCLMRVSK